MPVRIVPNICVDNCQLAVMSLCIGPHYRNSSIRSKSCGHAWMQCQAHNLCQLCARQVPLVCFGVSQCKLNAMLTHTATANYLRLWHICHLANKPFVCATEHCGNNCSPLADTIEWTAPQRCTHKDGCHVTPLSGLRVGQSLYDRLLADAVLAAATSVPQQQWHRASTSTSIKA